MRCSCKGAQFDFAHVQGSITFAHGRGFYPDGPGHDPGHDLGRGLVGRDPGHAFVNLHPPCTLYRERATHTHTKQSLFYSKGRHAQKKAWCGDTEEGGTDLRLSLEEAPSLDRIRVIV
jgi:hypothetical protein